jgi:hypothetical protein
MKNEDRNVRRLAGKVAAIASSAIVALLGGNAASTATNDLPPVAVTAEVRRGDIAKPMPVLYLNNANDRDFSTSHHSHRSHRSHSSHRSHYSHRSGMST